jgi:hypothetical protein
MLVAVYQGAVASLHCTGTVAALDFAETKCKNIIIWLAVPIFEQAFRVSYMMHST